MNPQIFWDFVQPNNPNQHQNSGQGVGVDHSNKPPPPPPPPFQSVAAGFPFGGGPGQGPPSYGAEWSEWLRGSPPHHFRAGRHGGRRGRHGRHQDHHHHPHEEETEAVITPSDDEFDDDTQESKGADTPSTARGDKVPDPEEVSPEDHDGPQPPPPPPQGPSGRGPRGPGRCGFRPGGGHHFGGGRPHHGGRDRPALPQYHYPPPLPPHHYPSENFTRSWSPPPFVKTLRECTQRFQDMYNNSNNRQANAGSFTPPVDVFNTERAFVLHVALPGAKKQDVGVNWDEASGVLSIAGVVHRPGDEEFLQTLMTGERRIGMFERRVTLPPEGSSERDDIDGLAITAKLEDGVLIVTVPKLEKEWTEIRKVDIE